jgi:hypothetical protein
MGVLSKLKNKEDNDFNDEDNTLEEQYQKMFKKIARDFVTYDELYSTISYSLLAVYESLGLDVNTYQASRDIAIAKALEYKENLSRQKTKRTKYKDITDD